MCYFWGQQHDSEGIGVCFHNSFRSRGLTKWKRELVCIPWHACMCAHIHMDRPSKYQYNIVNKYNLQSFYSLIKQDSLKQKVRYPLPDTISKLSYNTVLSPLRSTVSQFEDLKRGVCQVSPEILLGALSGNSTDLKFERKVSQHFKLLKALVQNKSKLKKSLHFLWLYHLSQKSSACTLMKVINRTIVMVFL